jgi:hypothetical protein
MFNLRFVWKYLYEESRCGLFCYNQIRDTLDTICVVVCEQHCKEMSNTGRDFFAVLGVVDVPERLLQPGC